MSNIKLGDDTLTGVTSVKIPLADGSGNATFSELPHGLTIRYGNTSNYLEPGYGSATIVLILKRFNNPTHSYVTVATKTLQWTTSDTDNLITVHFDTQTEFFTWMGWTQDSGNTPALYATTFTSTGREISSVFTTNTITIASNYWLVSTSSTDIAGSNGWYF